jgi:hypothetical protein
VEEIISDKMVTRLKGTLEIGIHSRGKTKLYFVLKCRDILIKCIYKWTCIH